MNAYPLEYDDDGTPCPIRSALSLCDEHINKMGLEGMQVLSTALILNGCPEELLPRTKAGTPYKKTHQHHPVVKWASESVVNWLWLVNHALTICIMKDERMDTKYACLKSFQEWNYSECLKYLPQTAMTPFALAMDDEFKTDDPVEAYRAFYNDKRFKNGHRPSWTHSSPPAWFKQQQEWF